MMNTINPIEIYKSGKKIVLKGNNTTTADCFLWFRTNK